MHAIPFFEEHFYVKLSPFPYGYCRTIYSVGLLLRSDACHISRDFKNNHHHHGWYWTIDFQYDSQIPMMISSNSTLNMIYPTLTYLKIDIMDHDPSLLINRDYRQYIPLSQMLSPCLNLIHLFMSTFVVGNEFLYLNFDGSIVGPATIDKLASHGFPKLGELCLWTTAGARSWSMYHKPISPIMIRLFSKCPALESIKVVEEDPLYCRHQYLQRLYTVKSGKTGKNTLVLGKRVLESFTICKMDPQTVLTLTTNFESLKHLHLLQ
ncbi:hypothetical protein BDA99DRAFT_538297 [Phascolomyces articulosus]|uniref:Uncharacterized protein n=1 Tax=Phascolomyces articulosus TaxID=60185 RepID=A0AAD5PDG6_9FUNG|nr:hypothetical protein BDA99DRAFT_538297 [Phascolomyces articulosus]